MKIASFFTGIIGAYVIGFLTLIVVVIISFTVIIPKIHDIQAKKQEISENRELFVKLERKKTLLTSIEKSDTVKFIEDALLALPSEKDAASVLIAFRNISAQTEFGIDSIDLSPGIVSTASGEQAVLTTPKSEKRNGADVYPISITGRGKINQLTDFIRTLENSRRLFDLSDLRITYSQEDHEFVLVNMTLETYFLPPITQLSTIESQLSEITPDERNTLTKISVFPPLSTNLDASLTDTEFGTNTAIFGGQP